METRTWEGVPAGEAWPAKENLVAVVDSVRVTQRWQGKKVDDEKQIRQ
jgi:hypothetical protein